VAIYCSGSFFIFIISRKWGSKLKKRLLVTLAITISIVFCFGTLHSRAKPNDPLTVTDVSRLHHEKVNRVIAVHTIEDLKSAVAEARAKKLKISISGSKHSQGGQTYYPNGIVLDMSSFNKIIDLDVKNKILRVQSGAKWKDVQEYINPYGLAVKVMQSSYIFTIGGTLSANAHGRDLDQSSVVETVRSFHLLNAKGEILNVSRNENSELFRLVIGGYGLFGIILDVELELTENEIYEQRSVVMDYKTFPEYFQNHIKNNPNISMMLVRPSIASKTFLRELVVVTWNKTDRTKKDIYTLTNEENVLRDKILFGLSRQYSWAKDFRWYLQKKIETGVGETRLMSRTNAMRPPLAPLEFLNYSSSRDTDILQEYFIPVRNFFPFMDKFRDILLQNKVNVISFTIRYVKPNDESLMAYAPKEDAFAIIYMTNVGLSTEAQTKIETVTQEIVDTAIANSGTYYLTYQLYPTREQLRKSYPQADIFFTKKLEYDPDEMFINKFYQKYAK
jgi:decaprenylphospho-beta-D-ribofuranose 2-oxidase